MPTSSCPWGAGPPDTSALPPAPAEPARSSASPVGRRSPRQAPGPLRAGGRWTRVPASPQSSARGRVGLRAVGATHTAPMEAGGFYLRSVKGRGKRPAAG